MDNEYCPDYRVLSVLMELTFVSSDAAHPRVHQSSVPTLRSELAARIEPTVRYWLSYVLY
jgi:hypothetical protein